MTNQASGGMFDGSDFRNAGGGITAVPGTGRLSRNIPKVTAPPIPKNTGLPSNLRLPLPESSDDGLKMPEITKQANPWAKGLNVTSSPNPWAKGLGAAGHDVNPWAKGLNMAARDSSSMAPDLVNATQGAIPRELPSADDAGSATSSALKGLAANFGVQAGTRVAVQQGLKKGLPRLGIQGLSKAPGLKGGIGIDTLINSGTDILDATGAYNIDGTKELAGWQKPKLDDQGQTLRDVNGSPQWDYGYNPEGFGWNMANHNKNTTPDGTIALGLSTGNPLIDDPASYATSAINAYNSPLKSSRSLQKFWLDENNPISRDSVTNWTDLKKSKGVLDTTESSLPLKAINNLVGSQPWHETKSYQPGGAYYDAEAERYKKQNKYHPNYNPAGGESRPWAGQRWWDKLWY